MLSNTYGVVTDSCYERREIRTKEKNMNLRKNVRIEDVERGQEVDNNNEVVEAVVTSEDVNSDLEQRRIQSSVKTSENNDNNTTSHV